VRVPAPLLPGRWPRRVAPWFGPVTPLFVQRTGVRSATGEACDSLAQWFEQHPGSACRLAVSGTLLHNLVLRDAALPLHGEAALQAYARQQWALVHGAAAEAWAVAGWSDGPLQVACALHGLDLPAVRQAARLHGVRLRGVRPWWAGAWRRAHDTPAWAAQTQRGLLLAEAGHTTWLTADAGGLCGLRQRRLAAPTLVELAALLATLQAEDGITAAATLLAGYGIATTSGAEPGSVAADTLPATLAGALGGNAPDPGWMAA
jgi:hypothetical protein